MEQIALGACYHKLWLQLWLSRALVIFLKMKFPAMHLKENEVSGWVRLEAKALFAPCQSNLSCMSASEKTHIMLAYSEEPGNLGCPFSLSLHFWKPCVVSMLPCPYRSWQPGAAKRLCLFVFPSSHLSVCWAAKEMQLRRVLVMFDSVCPSAFFMYGSIFVCVYLYHTVLQFGFVT